MRTVRIACLSILAAGSLWGGGAPAQVPRVQKIKVLTLLGRPLQFAVADQQGLFAKYGLELVDFLIGAITPPEEVQKMIDERAGMGAIGDMQRYMAFKAARGIEEAAKNPGEAGNAAGLGLGAGIGMMMPGMIAGALGAPARATAPAGTSVACPKCQTLVPEGMKFCGSCGTAMTASACPKCRAVVAAGARFCGNCGTSLAAATCPKCNAAVTPGSKFCGTCGSKLE